MKSVPKAIDNKGFTLVEIMVVVTIISILAGVATYASIQSSQKSRDAKRQADLTLLQGAVELYKNKYGRYPEGCNAVGGWSGQIGSGYDCADGSNKYILGANNRWFSEFMPTLPFDKKLNTSVANSGYVYQTNSNGTVYKIKAHRTVESEVVTYTHKFKPCEIRSASNAGGGLIDASGNIESQGWCGRVQFNSRNLPDSCRSTFTDWNKSYGVWGGFEPFFPSTITTLTGLTNVQKVDAVRNTTTIICR